MFQGYTTGEAIAYVTAALVILFTIGCTAGMWIADRRRYPNDAARRAVDLPEQEPWGM